MKKIFLAGAVMLSLIALATKNENGGYADGSSAPAPAYYDTIPKKDTLKRDTTRNPWPDTTRRPTPPSP